MSKLLMVILDGLCTDTLACAHVPCLDGLARCGYLSRRLQLQHPHSLLANLASLLTSMPPVEHGILSNSGTVRMSPHAVSLLSLLRYRQQNIAAFVANDRLLRLFPQGTLQTAMLINSQSIRNVDRELAQQAARHLQREKPECCLLCLDGPRVAGTHFGCSSEPYVESIEQADQALATILEHLRIVGAEREYTIVVAGCCAPRPPQAGDDETASLLLVSGPGIVQGREEEQPLSLLDLAPTLAAILGVAPHPDWRGRMLGEWFQRQPMAMRSLSPKKQPATRRRERLAA